MKGKLRWRLIALFAALALVAAACGGDDEGLGSAEDCETVDNVSLQPSTAED